MGSSPHLSEALPQFATPHEAAELLGKSVKTVWRQLRRGSLPGVKIGGSWYVNLTAIRELFEKAAS